MRHIFVRGLTANTHGNATGIGQADFTTNRLVRQMDYKTTVINCLTAGYPDGANLPVHFDSDREVVDAALAIIGTRAPEKARVMRIRDTLHTEMVEVSEPYLTEAKEPAVFQVLGPGKGFAFDNNGNLPDLDVA